MTTVEMGAPSGAPVLTGNHHFWLPLLSLDIRDLVAMNTDAADREAMRRATLRNDIMRVTFQRAKAQEVTV